MAKIEVEIPESAIVDELLWHAKHAEDKKVRKALRRSAAYFMTYNECLDAFGLTKTLEYWSD